MQVRPQAAAFLSGLALGVGEFARLVVPHVSPGEAITDHFQIDEAVPKIDATVIKRLFRLETIPTCIDWSNWLRSLSRLQRAIACTLAGGEITGIAARKFKICQARISQLRTWFKENWERFHGETQEKQPSVKACSH
jgi:hypothetical protein